MRAACALALLACSLPACAQVAVSRWGSYQQLPHARVDRKTLNLHLEFPLFNRATGNRAQAALRLNYDSEVSSYGAPTIMGGNGWWVATSGGKLNSTTTWQYGACGWSDGESDDGSADIEETDYSFTEADGTLGFTGSFVQVFGPYGQHNEGEYNDCPPSDTGPESFDLADGKGYIINIDSSGNATAYDGAGDDVSNGLTDPYGNAASISGGATPVVSDALGAAVTLGGAPTAGGSVTYTYTGPGGAQAVITEHFEQITVTGAGPYCNYSGAIVVPSSLVYPNGDTYSFGFDGAGNLDALTLPTGGVIHYDQTHDCSTGARTLSRWESVDGSSKSWAWSLDGATGQTTETTPDGNAAVYSFTNYPVAALTEVDEYSGAVGGTELASTTVTYGTSGGAITGSTTKTTLFGATPLYAEEDVSLDTRGATTVVSDYDWTTSATSPGPLLRSVATTYGSIGYADVPVSVTVSDASGQIAKSGYVYGLESYPTEADQWTSTTAELVRHFTYNSDGTIATATDVNGAVTTYGYSGGCGTGLFPTSVTSAAPAVHSSATWDCTGGVVTSSTDANNQTTSYTYADPSHTWRLTALQAPDGSVTNFTRTATSSESRMDFNGGNSTADTVVTLDALGRPDLTQKRQGPTATAYDSVQTRYDAMDRPYQVSMPYANTLGTRAGAYWTTTAYDALSRPLTVTDAKGGYTQYTYTQNDVRISREPGDRKRTQEETDALGRLRSVCEITSAGDGGSCGQDVAASGYLTSYVRNGRGQITQVTQGAQTRSYKFDELGRLTQETNPESGTTQYFFDADPSCSVTSAGDLARRLDANGNTTCYAYDKLHRAVEISYPSGPNASATSTRYFVYDAATVDGVAMVDVAGKLAEAYTEDPSGRITDLGFSYPDVTANEEDVYQLSPHSGGWYHSYATHQPNGALGSLVVPGVAANGYLDGEGRPAGMSANGVGLVIGSSRDATGQMTDLQLKSGDTDNYYYDAETGRMTEYAFTVGGQTDDGRLTWNANGALDSLAIADNIPGTVDSQTCSYGRDDLARLTSVSCGSAWSQTFTLDRWGNLAKSGNQSFGALYGANNRIASNGVVVPTYDADGNLVTDPVTGASANGFDAEGHAVELEGIAVIYDALGRAVEAGDSQGTAEFLYGPAGGKLAVMSGQTLLRADVPLPGGGTAVYNAGGLQYYTHADGLGSTRLASTPDHAVYYAAALAPYGETYAPTGSTNPSVGSFTGQHQDIVGGQYDFLMRELSPRQGRWWTPDPAGLAAVDPNNPQTWNRYAYVGGNPLTAIDPFGLAATCIPVARNKTGSDLPSNAEANGDFGPYDPGAGGDDGGYSGCANSGPCTGYILDGSELGCNPMGGAALDSGSAAQCPDNFCEGAAWSADGKSGGFVQFVATDGSVSGYYKPGALSSGIHDYHGQIYSDKGWHQEGNYLAFWGGQCMAVGNAVAASSAGGKIQGCNQTEGLHGGHENYTLNCGTGCTPGRYAGGLHVECANPSGTSCWAHMDTASPYSAAGFNFLSLKSWGSLSPGALVAHFAVDVIVGNFGVYAFGH